MNYHENSEGYWVCDDCETKGKWVDFRDLARHAKSEHGES